MPPKNIDPAYLNHAILNLLNNLRYGYPAHGSITENARLADLFDKESSIKEKTAKSMAATSYTNDLYDQLQNAILNAYHNSIASPDYGQGLNSAEAYSSMRRAARDPMFSPFYEAASDSSNYANRVIRDVLSSNHLTNSGLGKQVYDMTRGSNPGNPGIRPQY
jgi:hypothetical protein